MKAYQDDWENFLKYKEEKNKAKVKVKQQRSSKYSYLTREEKKEIISEKLRKRQRKYYQKFIKRRRWINKYKQSQGCHVCGYKENAYALSFQIESKSHSNNYIKWKLKTLTNFIRSKKIICKNCTAINFKTKNYSTNPER